MTAPRTPARNEVLEQLDRILSSSGFREAERSRTMLRFLVERTLDGFADRLKEYTVGAEALNRGVAFDPRTDPIVRAEASRLRARLDRYYGGDGGADPVIIVLPKGTYVPQFEARTQVKSRWRPRFRPVAWAVAGTALTIVAFAAGMWVVRASSTATDGRLRSFDVHIDANGTVGSEVGTDLAISADASRIVFVARDSVGKTRLYVHSFDGSRPVELAGTEGARGPFLSPDGRWVGFWSDGQLKKTSVGGGSPVVLAPASDLLGASWGEDGTIFFSMGSAGKLWRARSSGGAPVAIDINVDGTRPVWPQLLPGGSRVLYTALTTDGADRANVEVISLSTGERTVLVKGGTYGRYVTPGYLTYVNQGTLYAARFDLDRLEVHGSAVPIVDDVSYSPTFGYAQAVLSADGTLAYRRAPGEGRVVVAWCDSSGQHRPLLDAPGRYVSPALSPDGGRIALSAIESGARSTSIFDISGDHATRIAPPIADFGAAVWTRDGSFLVGAGNNGLGWIPASGGRVRSLLALAEPAAPWSFAPDGRLALHVNSPTTALDLWTTMIAESDSALSSGPAAPLLASPWYEAYPTYSPDGRWLAFASNASGSWEIYVRAAADSIAKTQVSRGSGRVPRWSRARNELFYATDDQRLMATTYTVRDGVFVASAPRLWMPARLAETGVFPNYDVAADGRRVVCLMSPRRNGVPPVNHVTLMLHLTDELRRRLP